MVTINEADLEYRHVARLSGELPRRCSRRQPERLTRLRVWPPPQPLYTVLPATYFMGTEFDALRSLEA